jgi:succinate-semialdehyde dehydrogenase/glutarate-semialdehyde dehydrogenase
MFNPPVLKNRRLLRDKCPIGGEWVGADKRRMMYITNPSTSEMIWEVPEMGVPETRRAIQYADAVLPAWGSRTAKERASILRRWFDLVMENQADLAAIITAEQGKPLAESRSETAYAASFIERFGEEGKRVYGDTIPRFAADKRIVVLKQPIGVCAAITPWNFPIAMIARKAGPALAAGCTMVVKPSSETPLSALALVYLAELAGVPKGVLSCVTGSASAIGGEMATNPVVKKLTFTGSTEFGKKLMARSAFTVKRTSMEPGGNAPFIVFDDADLDAAVFGVVASKYRNAGQMRVSVNRLLVQDVVYDAFVKRLSKAVAGLKVGDGFVEGTTIGPLINGAAVKKVEEHILDALQKGAGLAMGGQRHALGGTFFEPTVLVDATPDMLIFKEETFGPVAPVFRFKTEDEAVRLANDTEFGLAAYFYSRDIGRIWRVGEALNYGMVGINDGIISTEDAPFGGIKESGNGREGSKYGIEEYLETKYLCMGGIQ